MNTNRKWPGLSRRHRALSIYLHRTEGPAREVGSVLHHAVDSGRGRGVWDAANDTLRAWARSAPDLSGQPSGSDGDQVTFEVVFDNGGVYKGAFGLTRRDVEDGDLRQECLYTIHFFAGVYRPAGITGEKYAAFLESHPSDHGTALEMLGQYDFGAEFRQPVGLAVQIGGLTDV